MRRHHHEEKRDDGAVVDDVAADKDVPHGRGGGGGSGGRRRGSGSGREVGVAGCALAEGTTDAAAAAPHRFRARSVLRLSRSITSPFVVRERNLRREVRQQLPEPPVPGRA